MNTADVHSDTYPFYVHHMACQSHPTVWRTLRQGCKAKWVILKVHATFTLYTTVPLTLVEKIHTINEYGSCVSGHLPLLHTPPQASLAGRDIETRFAPLPEFRIGLTMIALLCGPYNKWNTRHSGKHYKLDTCTSLKNPSCNLLNCDHWWHCYVSGNSFNIQSCHWLSQFGL